MTKGIFIIIGIYGGLLGEVLFKGQFLAEIKKFKYWGLLLLTTTFLLPEIYALYTQFDLHLEKTVFGRQGFSGLKFFFWDSQFGRFFNSGPITRKHGDIFFFVHTLLWAFAPWCLLLYYTYLKKFREIFRKQKLREYYTLSGSLIMLLLFSVSGFQLPFYTNILFPLFAILCASVLANTHSIIAKKYVVVTQSIYVAAFLLVIGLLVLRILSFSVFSITLVISATLLIGIYFFVLAKKPDKLIWCFGASCVVMVLVNVFVNLELYPVIIHNKGEIAAVDFVNKNSAKTDSIFVFEDTNNIFQFYVNRPVKLVPLKAFTQDAPVAKDIYYVKQDVLDILNARHVKYTLLKSFWNYDNENLTPAFLNPATRASTLVKIYIITH